MTVVNAPRLATPPVVLPTPPAAAAPVPPTVAGLALLGVVGEMRRQAGRYQKPNAPVAAEASKGEGNLI